MKAKKISSYVIYQCNRSHGISVGNSLLEILEPRISKFIKNNVHTESILSCPSCEKKMKRYVYDNNIDLDHCKTCRLTWLDYNDTNSVQKISRLCLSDEEKNQIPMDEDLITFDAHEKAQLSHYFENFFFYYTGLPKKEKFPILKTESIINFSMIAIIIALSYKGFHDTKFLIRMAYIPVTKFWNPPSLLTSFFVHVNWMHLLINMYFLKSFGDSIEDYLGKKKYIFLIIASVILGNLTVAYWGNARMINMPHVGASGGIFGVIIFYLLSYPKSRFRFFTPYGSFSISATLMLFNYLGAQTIMLIFDRTGHVSYLTHLGGALAGILAYLIWSGDDT